MSSGRWTMRNCSGHETAGRSGCRAASTTAGLGLAKRRNHLGLERTARMGVDGPVDRLGADLALAVLRVHESQSGSDLVRRPESVAKTVTHPLPQPTALDQLATTNTRATPLPITTTGFSGPVTAGRRTTSGKLSADRRRRTPQQPRNRSQACSAVGFDHDRGAILWAQVFVLSFQGNLRSGP